MRSSKRGKAIISGARIRKALSQIAPPSDAMLLDERTNKLTRKLDATVKRGSGNKREVQALLKSFGSSSPLMTYTRGGKFSFGSQSRIGALAQILRGLYLPTADPDFSVPASRRYFDNQI